jgi:uncharacterized circularly permuted ATP-grasp superfamily protein
MNHGFMESAQSQKQMAEGRMIPWRSHRTERPMDGSAFDEMCAGTDIRAPYADVAAWLDRASPGELASRHAQAESIFRRRGITFAVYGDASGAERLIPFDLVPRVLGAREWSVLRSGCIQRAKALNAFLDDVYGAQAIIRAGVIPRDEIEGNPGFCKQAMNLAVPRGVHSHVSGIDVVRTGPDDWYVLEDNLRTPSGVSYMLENRSAMQHLFPALFRSRAIAPIDHYPDLLLASLRAVAPAGVDDPTIVVLTPGAYNSAYFEHGFLANRMGVRLVEGRDLFVEDDSVYIRDTRGNKRVDVIYRRIDDEYMDPAAFNPESELGIRGVYEAARKGRVTLANALGNGVADDKATYVHVPAMIRFYLDEEPILKNVPTYRCREKDDLKYVLEHLGELVVKEVHGSGGYGMLVGPASTREEREAFGARVRAKPEAYIAQPTLALSTCPTMVEQGIAPRHVDLRPFVLSGAEVEVVPGALTRVAMREGSLVVNSSQGGGTKDTWVLEE